jgi:hypothetical protein
MNFESEMDQPTFIDRVTGKHVTLRQALRTTSPQVQRVLGESVDDLHAYLEKVRPSMSEARERVAAKQTDPAEAASVRRGHGRYFGNCGHLIEQCRCSKLHPRIDVDAPCQRCFH